MKDYQSRYTEVETTLEVTVTENRKLKEQMDELKQKNLQAANDKGNQIQKLMIELDLLRAKESHKI